MRRCGRQYATEEEAGRSKAGSRPGAEIARCRYGCGSVHVTIPKPVKAKTAATKAKGFSRKVRAQCRARAGGGDIEMARCESCGCLLGRAGGQIQHRLARGSGGSKNPVVSSLANAALMCGTAQTLCHGDAESRDPGREMKRKGFVIDHGCGPLFDPRYVPIELASAGGPGMTVWLAEDGIGDDGNGYLFTSPLSTGADAAGLLAGLREVR